MDLDEIIAAIVKLEQEREEIYEDDQVTPAEPPATPSLLPRGAPGAPPPDPQGLNFVGKGRKKARITAGSGLRPSGNAASRQSRGIPPCPDGVTHVRRTNRYPVTDLPSSTCYLCIKTEPRRSPRSVSEVSENTALIKFSLSMDT